MNFFHTDGLHALCAPQGEHAGDFRADEGLAPLDERVRHAVALLVDEFARQGLFGHHDLVHVHKRGGNAVGLRAFAHEGDHFAAFPGNGCAHGLLAGQLRLGLIHRADQRHGGASQKAGLFAAGFVPQLFGHQLCKVRRHIAEVDRAPHLKHRLHNGLAVGVLEAFAGDHHHAALFLDELPEFSRMSMETMRQPIEDGKITISRVSGTLTYPSEIMLVCAMNPCPCGYYGHPTKQCTCAKGAPAKYLAKVSGPLLDRMDIHIEVPQVDFKKLSSEEKGESSADIKQRVNKARDIQIERFSGTTVTCNAKMTPELTRIHCRLDDACKAMLEKCFEALDLSARAYDKILRVARTIADLDSSESIRLEHITEAVQYRSLDRKFWRSE